MAVRQTSRELQIRLSPDLASKVEEMAERQSRSVSELLGEAFLAYEARSTAVRSMFEFADSIAHGYTEEDVPSLIREVREKYREEDSGRTR